MKNLILSKSLAALCLTLVAFACARQNNAQIREVQQDWSMVQRIVGRIHGISTQPPQDLITAYYSSGALLGNGDVGVVAGDELETKQSFHFGKSDFWGDLREDIRNDPTCNWNCKATILPLGRLTIAPSNGSGERDPDYLVDQDILHAQVHTRLDSSGGVIDLWSWVAVGTNLFVTKVSLCSGQRNSVPINLTLSVPLIHANVRFPTEAGTDHGVLWASIENGATGPDEYKAREAMAVRVLGAELISASTHGSSSGAQFRLRAQQPVWIVTSFESDVQIGTSGKSREALAQLAVKRAIRTNGADLIALENAHADWWKAFWLRSYVDVHDTVLEKYYYGALYVLGSAIRSNTLAPSMWGNFVTVDHPAWGGIYFMNYNEEAPYYGVFSSNHADLSASYNRMVLAQIPWQKNITAAAGYQGIAYARVFAPFTELAKPPNLVSVAPVKNYKKLPSDQKSNAAFSFLPLLQYYEYTQDRTFLELKLYPALKLLDAFWRDYAVRNSAGTNWEFRHSSAHEGGDDLNPNLDIGFARRVERELIETSQVLDRDAELRPTWENFLKELSPYPTGTVNGKDVFLIASDVHNPYQYHGLFEPGDQPINLEGTVFPGENLSIGGDPKQLQIARNSMQEMNSWGVNPGGNSENGFCKIFPIAARIGWPAEDLIGKFRAAILYQWRSSNLTVSQAGGGIETSGSIEALDSMLMQRENGVLRVFPDWPAERDASFTRLRAKGAFLVSSEQRSGRVLWIRVTSEKGGLLTVQSPWSSCLLKAAKRSQALHPNERGEVTLHTEPGNSYLLTP